MPITRDNLREFLKERYHENYLGMPTPCSVEQLVYGSNDCRIQLNVSMDGVTAKIYFIPGESGRHGLESYHCMMTIDDNFPEGLSYFQKKCLLIRVQGIILALPLGDTFSRTEPATGESYTRQCQKIEHCYAIYNGWCGLHQPIVLGK